MPNRREVHVVHVARTTEQAPGAIPNGTVVQKIASEPGDSHEDGAQARVLGSIGSEGRYGYCLEWSDTPGLPVWIAGERVIVV